MQRNTQSSLLKKYTKNDETVSPDRALRRAAAFGSVEEIIILIELGASVAARGEDEKTALHWAVLKEKMDNISVLIKNGASLYDVDKSGNTPVMYASESKNRSIREYFNNMLNPFHNETIIELVLPWLTYRELYVLKEVSFIWASHSKGHEDRYISRLPEGSKTQLEQLPKPLKHVIYKRLFDDRNIEKLKLLFSLLNLKVSERKSAFEKASGLKLPANITDQHLKDSDIVVLVLGIASAKLIVDDRRLSDPFIVYMLDEQLLTIEHLKLYRRIGSNYGTKNNLLGLCSENGIKALRQGLIHIDEAPYLDDLKGVLSKEGFALLENKLISSSLIAAMCRCLSGFSMHNLMEPEFLTMLNEGTVSFNELDCTNKKDIELAIAIYKSIPLIINPTVKALLQQKLITVAELVGIESIDLKNIDYWVAIIKNKLIPTAFLSEMPNALISKNGIIALEEGLITWQQAIKFKNLNTILSDNGLDALRHRLITIEDAILLSNPELVGIECPWDDNLSHLLSDQGMSALSEGVFTLEDAKRYSLAVLRIPNALQALKEKLITLEQVSNFYGYDLGFRAESKSIKALLSESGLQALREGLITPKEAAQFYPSCRRNQPCDNLDILLSPIGLIALRKKLIKPMEAIFIPCLEVLLNPKNPDIITAMELRLISPSDFKYGGKYCENSGRPDDMTKFTKELIANHYAKLTSGDEKSSKEVKEKSAVQIQKLWRSHVARNQYCLFRELNSVMQSGQASIHQLGKMNNAYTLIEKGKVQEARNEIEQIKTRLT